MSLRSLFASEYLAYGAWQVGKRIASRLGARFHGRLLGWSASSVPLGSNIIGTRRIHVGEGFFASGPVWVEAVLSYGGEGFSPEIKIGRNFSASQRVHISAVDRIEIGNNCLFGSNIYVADHAHGGYRGSSQSNPSESPASRPLRLTGSVLIGDNCWVGDNVVILGGVTIGSGAVIAANSVVLKDIPAMTIAAGTPARVVKKYDPETGEWVRDRG